MTYNADQFELIEGIVIPPPERVPAEHGVLFRAISSSTDVRTIIALPWHYTLPWMIADSSTLILCQTARDAAVLCAVMNSVVYDYLARSGVGMVNVNNFHVKQIPVPAPEDFEVSMRSTQTIADYCIERVVALTYLSAVYSKWATELIPHVTIQPWNPEVRLRLRSEIDAVVARVYGVDSETLRHIYGTFPIWERQEIKQYGSFVSRDLTLSLL